ncbi:MAG: hypothetical protein ACOY40_07425 [Bacillota bacterium]
MKRKTVTQAKKGVEWELEKLEYFKLISIEEDKSDRMKDAYMFKMHLAHGRGPGLKCYRFFRYHPFP